MPNSATRSALVDTATKCLATAASSPSSATTQSRAECALVSVSKVPKVFDIGNSDAMTVGRSVIRPGQANPRHYHPNCEEVLHVLQGTILHTFNDEEVEMHPGETIVIPANVIHNAKNIGDEEAIIFICFSSADRQTVWV